MSTSSPTVSPTKQRKEETQESKTGAILQVSTTVAGLAVAITIFLPSISKLVILKVGNTNIALLPPALLLCGLLALMASIWTLFEMSLEEGLPGTTLLVPKSSLSFLFWSLFLFALVYISVVITL